MGKNNFNDVKTANIIMSEIDFDYELNAFIKTVYPTFKVRFLKKDEVDYEAVTSGDNNILNLFIELNGSDVCLKSKVMDEGRAEFELEKKEEVQILPFSWRKDKEKKNPNRLIYKNALKRQFYHILAENEEILKKHGLFFRKPAWGTLTGVRPTKISFDSIKNGMSSEKLTCVLKNEYLLREDKAELAAGIAKKENEMVGEIRDSIMSSYSLYIGIPFCPTTCAYCSFTSYPLKAYSKHMDSYMDALLKEISFIREMYGDSPTTIYIGGGTPTALDEKNLERLLKTVSEKFDVNKTLEFTVEAGRVDSLNEEKLSILKNYNVGRISINPQTMHEVTLKKMGRTHSTSEVVKCYEMARKMGFSNINMDLIAGLCNEDLEVFKETVQSVLKLSPENITVHSLVIKRASAMREILDYEAREALKLTGGESGEDFYRNRGSQMDLMLDYAEKILPENGLKPYYMYRQKNADWHYGSVSQENIGFAKEGYECLYNVLMMEELQSIISAGAGASTKLYDKQNGTVSRVENVKSLKDYIERIDEMLEKKRIL